jgi:hypothetical protein
LGIHAETTHARREIHDADPAAWNDKYSKRVYKYAPKSGNSTLRGHIDRWHLNVYLELVEARDWPIWIDSVKNALELGYTVTELHQAVADGGTLEGLRARTSANEQRDKDSDGRGSIPGFSTEELYKHLIAFIVADDQVRCLPPLHYNCLLTSHSLSMSSNAKNSGGFCCSCGKVFATLMSPIGQVSETRSSKHGSNISSVSRKNWG